MKIPNLSTIDQYYPFYTIEKIGTKRHGRIILSVIHSFSLRTVLIISNREGKLSEMEITTKEGFVSLKEMKCISWAEFAEMIKPAVNFLKKSYLTGSGSSLYFSSQYLPEVFKYNENEQTLIEVDYNSISISHSPTGEYKALDGGIVQKIDRGPTGSELLDKLSNVLKPLHTYKSIDSQLFQTRFEYRWEKFLPYFESPKRLHKKEYKLD